MSCCPLKGLHRRHLHTVFRRAIKSTATTVAQLHTHGFSQAGQAIVGLPFHLLPRKGTIQWWNPINLGSMEHRIIPDTHPPLRQLRALNTLIPQPLNFFLCALMLIILPDFQRQAGSTLAHLPALIPGLIVGTPAGIRGVRREKHQVFVIHPPIGFSRYRIDWRKNLTGNPWALPVRRALFHHLDKTIGQFQTHILFFRHDTATSVKQTAGV